MGWSKVSFSCLGKGPHPLCGPGVDETRLGAAASAADTDRAAVAKAREAVRRTSESVIRHLHTSYDEHHDAMSIMR
jgi:hypothetical protein